MCNKRRTSFKHNFKRFKLFRIEFYVFLLISGVVISGCQSNSDPIQTNEAVLNLYPEVAEFIIDRDYNGLIEFTGHQNQYVSSLAWRAIAKTQPDDMIAFIDYVLETDSHEAWFALSHQELSESRLDSISDLYQAGEIQSEGVCEVFFRQGRQKEAKILLSDEDKLVRSELCSKALGGISVRVPLEDFSKRTIFDLVFSVDDFTIQRNLLYGFYRAALNRPRQGDPLMDSLALMLESRGYTFSAQLDEYIVRISGKTGFENVMQRRSARELNRYIQLSSELARNIILYEGNELPADHIKTLLRHKIPSVQAQALESLYEMDTVTADLLEVVETELTQMTRNSEVFVRSLELLLKNNLEVTNYMRKLAYFDDKNEHLKHRILPIYADNESEGEYLVRLQNLMSEGGISGLRATQALSNYFMKDIENAELASKARDLVYFALDEGDRSVVSALGTLIRNRALIPDEEFDLLNDYYLIFIENNEWTKAEDVGEALEIRFPERFEVKEIMEQPAFKPDWKRLFAAGAKPHLVLKTEKGNIEIELDPLSTPFTVSSILHLTEAGKYDDVPFHRVVRNFVIQGGDIDRKDGFGGPVYRLPTEPSLKTFDRGMVGVASSGTDTEGSQFFIMHQWSPHLDGNFTLFGEVKRGMDVADRIQIGDKVISAEISVR